MNDVTTGTMNSDKLARVQTNFRALMSEIHDCWYLSEQNGGYSGKLTKILHTYHKISWLDDCSMILDEDYFKGHFDGSVLRSDHRHTYTLHGLLIQLTTVNVFGQNLWSEFLFGMSPGAAQKVCNLYNLYMEDYKELVEMARLKCEDSSKKDGSPSVTSEGTTA